MADTTYGSLSQRTAAWASMEALAHAEPIIVLGKFGLKKPIPKNKADNVKFRRPVPYTVSTVPAAEGVTPTAQALTYEDVNFTLLQYIGVAKVTDKVRDLAEDPVLKDAMALGGEQAAETVEMVTYGKLIAGTSYLRTNGTLRTDVNTVFTLDMQRACVRFLQSQRAKYINNMLSSSTNFGSVSVEPSFIGFCSTDLTPSIRDMDGFKSVADYGSRQVLPFEIGCVEDVRYVASPLFTAWADGGGDKGTMYSTTGTKADVYPILICGKEAWGTTALKGAGAITPVVVSGADKSDPADQFSYITWKTWFTGGILNEAWMVRVETATPALTTVTSA